MKKRKISFMKRVMSWVLLCAVAFGCVSGITVTNAAKKKPLVGVTYSDYQPKTMKLYEGMQWSPTVTYEYGEKDAEDNVAIEESVGTLIGASFTSNNKKVATVDENGIITAKKAGTAKIKIASQELNQTITIKVLAIGKVNKKNLTKEAKLKSDDFDWPLFITYDNTDQDVKKGYVKANKGYKCSLYSVRQYKQPNGKYRYVFAYQVLNKKGKAIKGLKLVELPVEQVMGYWGLCVECEKFKGVAASFVKGEETMHWQTMPYPTKAELKQKRLYARENIYKSEDDYYKATLRYGWRNMCA